MSCGLQFLSTCNTPHRVSLEGHAGRNAHIYIPFAGIYFFSGQNYTFPGSTIGQYKGRTSLGITKPDTFNKGFSGLCGS